jgi:hypothetical protein
MRKIILSVSLFLFTVGILFSLQHNSIEELPTATINVDSLRIRSTPNLSGEILSTFNKNDFVGIIERSQEKENIDGIRDYWYLITNHRISGWVFGGYVTLNSDANATITPDSIITGYYEEDEDRYVIFPHDLLYNDEQFTVWKLSRRNLSSESVSIFTRFEQLFIHHDGRFFTVYKKQDLRIDMNYQIVKLDLVFLDSENCVLLVQNMNGSAGPRSNSTTFEVDFIFYNTSNKNINFIDDTGLKYNDHEGPIYDYSYRKEDTGLLYVFGTARKNDRNPLRDNLDLNRLIQVVDGQLFYAPIYQYPLERFNEIPFIYLESDLASEKIDITSIEFIHVDVISTMLKDNQNWHELYLIPYKFRVYGMLHGWIVE